MRGPQIISEILSGGLDHLVFETYDQPGREGVEIHRLYDTTDTGPVGPAAAIVRYRPGAQVQRHIHPGYELIFVIEGELINDAGRHPAGTLEICPPGSSHALGSEKGCTFLVIWEQPVMLAKHAATHQAPAVDTNALVAAH
ncbi:cupin domain-containing protein [Salinarimonas rosea]|uniref:cupin domain-containing protein n=1 Tax=Salinarimonas rosea TaxID=552063 RepID=UPI0004148C85|nr:cupin domain-containing protein [Salinarimonas rosea]